MKLNAKANLVTTTRASFIRMHGQSGRVFSRLSSQSCSLQIFMKYGRQRWKLRGRIEVNAKQVWDSEEVVFLPLVSEFLSIKVRFDSLMEPFPIVHQFQTQQDTRSG